MGSEQEEDMVNLVKLYTVARLPMMVVCIKLPTNCARSAGPTLFVRIILLVSDY